MEASQYWFTQSKENTPLTSICSKDYTQTTTGRRYNSYIILYSISFRLYTLWAHMLCICVYAVFIIAFRLVYVEPHSVKLDMAKSNFKYMNHNYTQKMSPIRKVTSKVQ